VLGVLPDDSPAGQRESFIHLEVDRVSDAARLESLAADIARVLGDVRAAVQDWKMMSGKVREILADLARRPPPVGQAEVAEMRAFLEWLADNHFTFLGYRCHDLVMKDGDDALAAARREKPDLIFLDIMMPGLSGDEVCRRLKSDPETRSTHVVILTARGQEEDERRAMDEGYVFLDEKCLLLAGEMLHELERYSALQRAFLKAWETAAAALQAAVARNGLELLDQGLCARGRCGFEVNQTLNR